MLDDAVKLSGVSFEKAFSDFLLLAIASLSAGQMESTYLKTIQPYERGIAGERVCDKLATMFGRLVAITEKTRRDVLGDLFQGAMVDPHSGQFFTPENACDLLAASVLPSENSSDMPRLLICDPSCGSGRMLLAAAQRRPEAEFVGKDIDACCVRMTAINLALRNLYGYVIHGDALGSETHAVYRTGLKQGAFIREIDPKLCPTVIHPELLTKIQPREVSRLTVRNLPDGTQF